MFEVNRESILTIERHGAFLRRQSIPMNVDYNGRTYKGTWARNTIAHAGRARDFVANKDNEALGLAGPQVGSKTSWFVMNFTNGYTGIIFNPIIVARYGNKQYEEGCFSEPGVSIRVKRAREITVTYHEVFLYEDGDWWVSTRKNVKLVGRDAQVFQHEYDHLQGILLQDRIKAKGKPKAKRGWF
jgi:peptide deformylase